MKEIKLLPPFKNFILENFPFIEEDFDALTNYELLCHLVGYIRLMGKEFNDIAEDVNTLINWFNNLDVQDEINNKLDEMALDGTLDTIVSNALSGHYKVEYIFPKFWATAYSGDANIIKHHGKSIMIDCYGTDQWVNVKQMLDDNSVTHIDYMILTHYHTDHYGNFENLVTYGYVDSETVIFFPAEADSFALVPPLVEYFKAYCLEHDLTYRTPVENEVINIYDLSIKFLNCNPATQNSVYYDNSASKNYNNCSTVCLISHKEVRSLYMGDCSEDTYPYFVNNNIVKGKIDLLKIGHHGINLGTTPEFFKQIHPIYAVQPSGIKDAIKNNYGRCPEVSLLRELGTIIYPTHMQNNYIKISSNLNNIHVENGKPYAFSSDRYNVNLYVDINAATNAIQDGSQAHPYSELMQAIGVIDANKYENVNIYIANGSYGLSHESSADKNTIYIRKGVQTRINLRGNAEHPELVKLHGVVIENSNVDLYNLYVDVDNITTNGAITVYGNSKLLINNCIIDSVSDTPSTKSGLYFSQNSDISVYQLTINNVNKGIVGADSRCYLNDITFGDITEDITSFAGVNYITNNLKFNNAEDKLNYTNNRLLVKSPDLLYSSDGSTYSDTYTLARSVQNYAWVEIEYKSVDTNVKSTGRIYNPHGALISISCEHSNDAGAIYNKQGRIVLLNNTLTIDRQRQISITSGSTVSVTSATERFSIIRVVAGYNDYVNKTS